MRRRIAICCTAALLAGLGRGGPAQAEGVSKERAAPPPEPRPLKLDGVRYEAPHDGRSLGQAHNGGWLVAYDAASGTRLWVAPVYGLFGPPDLEADKREVFIVEMRADASGRRLKLRDERGRRWLFDLQKRTASQEATPAPRSR